MAASVKLNGVVDGFEFSANFSKKDVEWAFGLLADKLKSSDLPADENGRTRRFAKPSEFMLMCRGVAVGFGVATRWEFKHYNTRDYIVMHVDPQTNRPVGFTYRKGAWFGI